MMKASRLLAKDRVQGLFSTKCTEILENYRSPALQPAESPTRVFPVRASAGASLIQ